MYLILPSNFFLYYTGYLILVWTCKKIDSSRSCSATRSCFSGYMVGDGWKYWGFFLKRIYLLCGKFLLTLFSGVNKNVKKNSWVKEVSGQNFWDIKMFGIPTFCWGAFFFEYKLGLGQKVEWTLFRITKNKILSVSTLVLSNVLF